MPRLGSSLVGGHGSVLSRRFGGGGRVGFVTTSGWIALADDNFWLNNENFTEAAGTAPDPLLEYEVFGEFIYEGERVTALRINAAATSAEVADVEYALYHRAPSMPLAGGQVVADAGMTNTLIQRGFFSDTLTGPLMANARYGWTLPLDFTCPADGEVTIYLRPTGTITGTRYLRFVWQWKAEPRI